MILFFIFAVLSIVFFLISLFRFPSGSFQNVILYLMAALCMYLAFSDFTITQTVSTVQSPAYNISTPTGNVVIPSYNTTYTQPPPSQHLISLIWDFDDLYILVCVLFATIGLILRRLLGKGGEQLG